MKSWVQGIPAALKERISRVLRPATFEVRRRALSSRIGVAKYHLFNDGVKFSRRRARKKRLVCMTGL